jgi:hypothetical protein
MIPTPPKRNANNDYERRIKSRRPHHKSHTHATNDGLLFVDCWLVVCCFVFVYQLTLPETESFYLNLHESDVNSKSTFSVWKGRIGYYPNHVLCEVWTIW